MACDAGFKTPGAWRRAAVVAAASGAWLVALSCFLLPFSNPDLFWHLSAAKRIASLGAIPDADWLSHTMQGRPWADFEWLCQLLWAGALRGAGLWGLLVWKAGLFAAAALCLWRGLSRCYGVGVYGRSLALLFWCVALAPANDLRPENFSLIGFSLLWWFLEGRRLGPRRPAPGGRPSMGTRLAVLAGFALWANLHAGFFYGLVLLGIYGAVERLERGSWEIAELLWWAGLGSLLNPYGWGVYGILYEHYRYIGDLQEHILEWQEPSVLSPWLAAFWALLLAVFLILLTRLVRERTVPWEHLFAACFYAWSASSHARTSLYFVLIGVPIAACHFGHTAWGRWEWARRWGAGLAAAGLILFFLRMMAPELLRGQPFLPRFSPDQVAAYLRREKAVLGGHRMLNPWHWGGYLGYKLYPEYQVFCDGRYIFHSLIRPILEAQQTPEAYRAFLDRYGIDIVIHKRMRQFLSMPVELPDGRKQNMLRPYYLVFLPRSDWALAYWGMQGAVFVRRRAFPEAWLRAGEFKAFRPDDLRAAELMVEEGLLPWTELADEMERFLSLSPGLPEEIDLRRRISDLKARVRARSP